VGVRQPVVQWRHHAGPRRDACNCGGHTRELCASSATGSRGPGRCSSDQWFHCLICAEQRTRGFSAQRGARCSAVGRRGHWRVDRTAPRLAGQSARDQRAPA
jgi:hypothetical protein